jgi:glutamine amidotransferase-like uncharacterized protein
MDTTLAVGGGNAALQYKGLGFAGQAAFQDYLFQGNNYLGICAGGYLATKKIMNFLNATYDSVVALQASKESKYTKYVREISTTADISEQIACKALYWHGPEFCVSDNSIERILVTYQDKHCPAVVLNTIFRSKVLGVSYHPEVDIETLPDDYMIHDLERQQLKKELDSSKSEMDQLTKLLFSKIGFVVK